MLLGKNNILKKLCRLLEAVGEDNIFGVILPSWPSPWELVEFKSKYPATEVMLSVSRQNKNYKKDYNQLYRGLQNQDLVENIDGILLDCNYYHFPEMDALYVRDCVDYLATYYPHYRIGVEGVKGLIELSRLKNALPSVPGIGITAEDMLRTKKDHLDVDSAIQFIHEAVAR